MSEQWKCNNCNQADQGTEAKATVDMENFLYVYDHGIKRLLKNACVERDRDLESTFTLQYVFDTACESLKRDFRFELTGGEDIRVVISRETTREDAIRALLKVVASVEEKYPTVSEFEARKEAWRFAFGEKWDDELPF